MSYPTTKQAEAVEHMDKKLAKIIGQAARTARERAQLTQADVADKVDLVTEVYGRIERGGMVPSVPSLVRICRALRVSADELLGLAGPGGTPRFDLPEDQDERPEIRPVIRIMRDLPAEQLKLLRQVAQAMKKE
jgi:transcriptional regulator with XRE-family HTH domain